MCNEKYCSFMKNKDNICLGSLTQEDFSAGELVRERRLKSKKELHLRLVNAPLGYTRFCYPRVNMVQCNWLTMGQGVFSQLSGVRICIHIRICVSQSWVNKPPDPIIRVSIKGSQLYILMVHIGMVGRTGWPTISSLLTCATSSSCSTAEMCTATSGWTWAESRDVIL